MARYISASKLCLVVLTRIYVEDYVPPSGTIEVLSFIGYYIDPEIKRIAASQKKKASTDDSQYLLSLEELHGHLNLHTCQLPGKNARDDFTVWDVFKVYLLKISNMHTMCHFLSSLGALLLPDVAREDGGTRVNILAANSPLGLFVRRVRVESENLQFPDVMKLWSSFERFVQPLRDEGHALYVQPRQLYALARDLNVPEMGDPQDEVGEGDTDDAASGGLAGQILARSAESHGRSEAVSVYDVGRLLEFQIERMRRRGGYLPSPLQAQLTRMAKDDAETSKLLDYTKFLEAWFKGDYSNCFEYMHRYYDYAMADSDRRVYQNVLLQMATVQADFGCYSEAMSAMDQAIAVARENKDKQCLHYCLSWLHQLRLSGKQDMSLEDEQALLGGGSSGLEYLKDVSQKENVPGIQIPTLFTEACYYLTKGEPPLAARQLLYEAEHSIIYHRLYNFKPSHDLILADVYSRMGVAALSISYRRMAVSSPDVSADAAIAAHCSLAYTYTVAGKNKLAADAMKTAQASASLNLRSQQLIAQYQGLVDLRQALHHNDLGLASCLIPQLKAAPTDQLSLKFAASLLETDYLVRNSDLSSAFALVEELFIRCNKEAVPDAEQRIRLMTTKAYLFTKIGLPLKGFTICLRAILAAQRCRNVYALLEAIGAMAKIFTALDQWEASVKLIESAKGRLQETQDALLLARALGAGVEALVQGAESMSKEEDRRRALLQKASTWAEQARAAYAQLEDYAGQRDTLRTLAGLSTRLGDIDQARKLTEHSQQAAAQLKW